MDNTNYEQISGHETKTLSNQQFPKGQRVSTSCMCKPVLSIFYYYCCFDWRGRRYTNKSYHLCIVKGNKYIPFSQKANDREATMLDMGLSSF
jgi:hypothetical protein